MPAKLLLLLAKERQRRSALHVSLQVFLWLGSPDLLWF